MINRIVGGNEGFGEPTALFQEVLDTYALGNVAAGELENYTPTDKHRTLIDLCGTLDQELVHLWLLTHDFLTREEVEGNVIARVTDWFSITGERFQMIQNPTEETLLVLAEKELQLYKDYTEALEVACILPTKRMMSEYGYC